MTDSELKSAPLPWEYKPSNKDDNYDYDVVDANGEMIMHNYRHDNFAPDKEDAQLVVTSVNSHKELIEALESAYILLSANDKKMEEIFGGIYREQKVKIGKALKKAKGE